MMPSTVYLENSRYMYTKVVLDLWYQEYMVSIVQYFCWVPQPLNPEHMVAFNHLHSMHGVRVINGSCFLFRKFAGWCSDPFKGVTIGNEHPQTEILSEKGTYFMAMARTGTSNDYYIIVQ